MLVGDRAMGADCTARTQKDFERHAIPNEPLAERAMAMRVRVHESGNKQPVGCIDDPVVDRLDHAGPLDRLDPAVAKQEIRHLAAAQIATQYASSTHEQRLAARSLHAASGCASALRVMCRPSS